MAKNKALARIEKLLDDGSFVEFGEYVTARITDFTLKYQAEQSDGVITGYGQIDGNPVFVYSQNREVLNGTLGEMHAKKIAALYDKATRSGAPVIGLIDCGGFRLQESVDALDGFGEILTRQMNYSNQSEALQICGIMGNCAGGMTLIPALSDYVYMTKDAQMFVNAPHTITDDQKLARDFHAANYQNEISGQAEVLETEDEVLEAIRNLVLMLTDAEYGVCDEAELNRYVSDAVTGTADTRGLLKECADSNLFVEIRPSFHPEMVTGFLKLNGILVGAIGTASTIYNEKQEVIRELPKGLTAGGCEKAADFVKKCNQSEIPVLVVEAADGFEACAQTEQNLPRALAGLATQLADCWPARVNLIIGDTYGSAYAALNVSTHSDASQMIFAWENVKVGMMQAEKAANILFAQDEEKESQAAAFEAKQNSVWSAAARGSIDMVIDPKQTRKHLIMAFSVL